MEQVLVATIASLGTVGLTVVLGIFFWDKVELFFASIFKFLGSLSGALKFFRKKAAQLDLQGRINSYIKKLNKIVPELETSRFKIDWVNPEMNRKAFFDAGRVVLRLRDSDTDDDNFVHGTYLFVSTALLYKVKHHLSPSQKESADLFVTADIIKKEKNYIIDKFVDSYLQPILEGNKKKRDYYASYDNIHKHGYFYPVLISELDYLGRKVFASVSKSQLVKDFDNIIDFLNSAANRKIGDDLSNLEYRGQNTRMAIFIIGKPNKIADEERYEHFLQKRLAKENYEGIYAVGDSKNKEIIDRICSHNGGEYEVVKCGQSDAMLNLRDGSARKIEQYYVVLRKKDAALAL